MEQDTNRGAGREFGVDEKNCSRSRIVASPYYGIKILVAVASDRANTVFQRMLEFQKFELAALVQHENIFSLALVGNWLIYATPPG